MNIKYTFFILNIVLFILPSGFTARVDEYENYSTAEYKGYPRKGTDVYDWYDLLGQKLTTGYSIYDFYDLNTDNILTRGESHIFKSYRYNRWLNELIVLADELEGSKQRLIIGDEIKTKFSSFVLDKASFSGIRWDWSASILQSSLIFSRISDPVVILNNAWVDPQLLPVEKAVYLTGIYEELRWGKQKVGLTYVNGHTDNKNLSRESMYGTGTGITGIGIGGGILHGSVLGLNHRTEYLLSNSYVNSQPGTQSYPVLTSKISSQTGNFKFKMGYHYVNPNYTTNFEPTGEKVMLDSYSEESSQYMLVDDNDDNDQFPDYIDQKDWNWIQAQKQSYFNYPDGVFPGLDRNQNGLSDYNENRNTTPDYEEDFLRFYIDPPQFEPGDDLNNNGIIDTFENDNLPDYEYKRDRTGWDLVTSYQFNPGLNVTLSLNNESMVSSPGKKSVFVYSILDYTTRIVGLANLRLEYRLKRVQDIIPDETIQYAVIYQSGRPEVTYTSLADLLPMRDSLVNTMFMELNYNRFLNLEISTKLKYEINQQDISTGLNYTASFLGIINRIKYELKVADKFTILPMIKTQWQTMVSNSIQNNMQNVYLLRTDYALTKKTRLSCGVQFLPYRDLVYLDNGYPYNYDKTTYLVQLTSQMMYLKYSLAMVFGAARETVRWTVGPQDTFDRIFVQVYMGG